MFCPPRLGRCAGQRISVLHPKPSRAQLAGTTRTSSRTTTTSSVSHRRAFASSPIVFKKGGKAPQQQQSKQAQRSGGSPTKNKSSDTEYTPEDPLDFSSLTTAYGPIDAHFKTQLQSVVHGGRFNPEQLGALPVAVKGDSEGGSDPASTSGGTFPLSELAQVVPRSGRTISLLVNDRAYIKPIMSAIQASRDFNQQPQRSEDNDLELLLRVELERREELVRRIKDAAQGWRDRLRQARSKHDKQLKDWKKTGAVLPDVVKLAERELQKLQDKKMKEVDQEEAQTVKQLDRN